MTTGTAEGDVTINVVVVDDHPSYAYGLATLLETLTDDIRVVAVASAVDAAVSLVEENRPDIALLDVRMPHQEGLELAAKLCSTFTETKVAMLSGFQDEQDVRKALAAGARGYLSKQADPHQLIAAIRALDAGFLVVSGFAAPHFSTLMPPKAAELTDPELNVLRLLARGEDIATVARELLVSESTLKRVLRQVQHKLGVESRIEAVVEAVRKGLL